MSKDLALAAAAAGYAVIPIVPGTKRPAVAGWEQWATADAARIERHWAQHPEHGVGIATGRFNGGDALLAVDLDVKGNGPATWAQLIRQHGEPAPTFEQKTPSGGRHLLFRVPSSRAVGNSARKIGAGIDTRGRGGQIVLYTSPDQIRPPAPAPDWLIAKCRPTPPEKSADAPAPATVNPAKAAKRAIDYLEREAPLAVEGQGGDETTFRVAARLKDLGVNQAKAEALMLEHWNERCSPPWLPDELAEKVRNAYTYGQNPPGSAAPEAQFTRVDPIAGADKWTAADIETNRFELKRLRSESPERYRELRELWDLLGVLDAAEVDTLTNAAGAKPAETDPEWLAEMNSRYFVVNEAGRAVVYRPTRDDVLRRDVLERISFEDFRKLHMNRPVKAGKRIRSVADTWLEHPRRRQYLGGVVFAPGQDTGPDTFNLWRGFAVKPKPGDWGLIRAHIRDVICSGNAQHDNYLMGWLARLVQKPGERGEVAVVLRGGKGVGKGALGGFIQRLFGQHALHILNARHLTGNFNEHLRDAVFLFADEAFFAGDRQHESVLKGLVTEPVLLIEGKFRTPVTVRNVAHLLMASNEEWVVPAGPDERRYFVLDVSPHRQGDSGYFTRLFEEADNGGLEAMLFDLLHRDLSKFDVRSSPRTDALGAQKQLSLRGADAWLRDVLAAGRIGNYPLVDDAGEPALIPRHIAYEHYETWAQVRGRGYATTLIAWSARLSSILKECLQSRRPRIEGTDRPRCYVFAPLRDCRAQFEKFMGQAVEWGDDDGE